LARARRAGFRALLALGASGAPSSSSRGSLRFRANRRRYEDALAVRRSASSMRSTLDRCLWASDWPYLRAPERGRLRRLATDWRTSCFRTRPIVARSCGTRRATFSGLPEWWP
jgi:hypothetical protein